MITIEQAQRVAATYLDGLQAQIGMPLQIVDVADDLVGWVFFYNSKAYIDSGDASSMLVGNAPFLVDSNDGSLHVLGTAEPLDVYLDEYRRTRDKTQSNI